MVDIVSTQSDSANWEVRLRRATAAAQWQNESLPDWQQQQSRPSCPRRLPGQ
jgi:hypothetical protein